MYIYNIYIYISIQIYTVYPHSIFACVCIAKDRRSAFAIYDRFLWNSSELCKDAENSTDVFVQATKAFVIANGACSDVWHKNMFRKTVLLHLQCPWNFNEFQT